jgi:hypothetical protein
MAYRAALVLLLMLSMLSKRFPFNVNVTYLLKENNGNSVIVSGLLREAFGDPHAGIQPFIPNRRHPDVGRK